MSQLTFEQVQNRPKFSSIYYVVHDYLDADNRKVSGAWLSPFYTTPKEAKDWKANYTGPEVTIAWDVRRLSSNKHGRKMDI